MNTLLAAVILAAAAAQGPADAVLRADVQKRINAVKLGSAKITVMVDGHTVMLDGTLPTLWLKRQVIEAAVKTPGAEKVQSTIAIAKAESDDQLAYYVADAIGSYPKYYVYDYIDGAVKNGAATLVGAVTTDQKLAEILERIEKIRGLQNVDNRIKVLPVSQSDDQLRVTIANRIYNDPAFMQYSLATPAVHVIVENGRVTLIGQVSGEIEHQKAVSIAGSVPGVFSVSDQIAVRARRR